MILTGSAIDEGVSKGTIIIGPYDRSMLNPNSYNYRLGNYLKKAKRISSNQIEFEEIALGEDGIVLEPQTLYLGHTHEIIGSTEYAMSLIGRSSLGRLGLFLQTAANLGHTGSAHSWTLEIVACIPIRVYPLMRIGQVSFWRNLGTYTESTRTYDKFNKPQHSFQLHEDTGFLAKAGAGL